MAGEVDTDSCALQATTIRATITVERAAALVVDLERVHYLDAGGISSLVDGFHFAVKHGVAYQVVKPNVQAR